LEVPAFHIALPLFPTDGAPLSPNDPDRSQVVNLNINL
jgi:hypothetical protein